MKSKKIVRAVCALLALLMLAGLVFPVLYSFAESTSGETPTSISEQTFSSEQTSSSSSTTQADINAKREEYQQTLNALREEQKQLENQIASGENTIATQQKYKASFVQEANTIKSQIELTKTQIAETRIALEAKQNELAAKIEQKYNTQQLFNKRLVAIYTTRNENDLSAVLGATSFASMMRYSENLEQISLNDTDLIQKLRTEQAELETQAAEVQTMLDELNAQEEFLYEKQQEYAAAIQKTDEKITQAEAEVEAKELTLSENQKLQEAAMAEWNAFAQASNVGFVWDGGTFSWPLPGYFRLSSDYGVGRWVYGVYDVHRGMDLPAPAGTTIYAAADGQVSTKAHWSYGTCVKLDHGSGLVTIYGHMSQRYVSEGQYVTKGTPIGAVGSTGNSTGNHLHFEVDINGSPTSPRNYLDPDVVNRLYW